MVGGSGEVAWEFPTVMIKVLGKGRGGGGSIQESAATGISFEAQLERNKYFVLTIRNVAQLNR